MWGAVFQVAQPEEDTPKATPPPATELSFPALPRVENANSNAKLSDLEKTFTIKNYRGFSEKHLQAIGFHGQDLVAAEELVPASFLPSRDWYSDPVPTGERGDFPVGLPSSQTLSNGAAVPGQEVFHNRVKELQYDSKDAYHFLAHGPPRPDRKSIKITHFRNFWIALQQAGGFWDTSLDNWEAEDNMKPEQDSSEVFTNQSASKPASNAASSTPSGSSVPPMAAIAARAAVSNSSTFTASRAAPAAPAIPVAPNPSTTASAAANPGPSETLTYTGRRHSNGASMPQNLREDLIRGFLEPILSAFGCRLDKPTRAPKLFVGALKIEADHSGRVYRLPADRNRNRAGIVEGPLMGLLCRPEVEFGPQHGNTDLIFQLRELSMLLSLAQERHREGKKEVPVGKGKWWADPSRFGPEWGVAFGVPIVNELELLSDEPVARGPDGRQKRSPRAMQAAVLKRQVALAHRPPGEVWEQRVLYKKVGKGDGEVDTVFAISSINHHISVLRLRVHPRLLDLIRPEEATSLSPEHAPGARTSTDGDGGPTTNWSGVELKRSPWYDLFSPEERTEAMGVVWGVMGWLMRDVDSDRKGDDEDDNMED